MLFSRCSERIQYCLVERLVVGAWCASEDVESLQRMLVLLGGEMSEIFDVEQGGAQGCNLTPILFLVFINGWLVAVEQAGLGIVLSDGDKVGGLLFADDSVGVSECGEQLQKLIDVVHSYWCRGLEMFYTLTVGSEDNESKSVVMTFGKHFVEDNWGCGTRSA